MLIERRLKAEVERVHTSFLEACRWQYILSGRTGAT